MVDYENKEDFLGLPFNTVSLRESQRLATENYRFSLYI